MGLGGSMLLVYYESERIQTADGPLTGTSRIASGALSQ